MDETKDQDFAGGPSEEQRFSKLVHRYFEGDLDATGAAELSDLLKTDPHSRKLLVDMTQQRMALVRMLREPHAASPSDEGKTQPTSAPPSTAASGGELPRVTADAEWFIREVPLRNDLDTRGGRPEPNEQPLPGGSPLFESWLAPRFIPWGLAAAAVVALMSLVIFGLSGFGQPAAAKLIAVAQPRWGDSKGLALGEHLPARKKMRLEYGAVEFRFPDSATVVIRGPAEFQVLDRGRFELTNGALSAHVPPRAVGFVVETAGLTIRDLGTEFVLSVGDQGHAQVTVLDGRVETATPTDSRSEPQRLVLAAGESLARNALGAPLVPAPAPAPVSLPRDITGVRVPLVLHGSGVGLKVGVPDPAWRITSVPNDPNYIAKPAIVARPVHDDWMPNKPDESQWLGLADPVLDSPPGNYVFETTVDLTAGIDPSDVVIHVRVIADNAVRRVRLNGHDIGFATPPERDRAPLDRYSDFSLDQGLLAGENQIEFDVENLDNRGMALRVALEGSGRLIARRLGEP
jgi:hypothetical protein